MSNLTNEDLQTITDLVNARLDEFNGDFGHLSRGIVRLAYDVFLAWPGEQAQGEYHIGHTRGYEMGYQLGYEVAKAEMSPARDEAADKPRLVSRMPVYETGMVHEPAYRGDIAPAPEFAPSVAEPTVLRLVDFIDKYDLVPCAECGLYGTAGENMRAIEGDWYCDNHYPADPEPVEPTPDQVQWQAEYEAAPAVSPTEPPPKSDEKLTNGNHAPDPDVAREKIAHALANESGGALILGTPRTLAEVDNIEDDLGDDEDKDELPTKRVRPNGKRVPHRRPMAQEVKRPAGTHMPDLAALVKEVKRQSMAGVMPTQAAFDVARPATWATAQAHLLRLNLTWASLAEEAGLKLKRPK